MNFFTAKQCINCSLVFQESSLIILVCPLFLIRKPAGALSLYLCLTYFTFQFWTQECYPPATRVAETEARFPFSLNPELCRLRGPKAGKQRESQTYLGIVGEDGGPAASGGHIQLRSDILIYSK